MKKINKTGLFVITIFIITTTSLLGQATDLFFSEYIEGSSYNKALEIFNGTGMDIDLSNYQLWQIGNGGNWPEYTVDISGTLPDGEVFVVCHPDANPTMLAVADLVVTLYHNGNDAQGLAKDDGTGTFYLIDTIGEDGDAPEYGWDVAGVPEATKDHTLVRKASIGNPNTDWNSSAGTNADNSEWIVYDKDTFDYLGSHTFTGGGGDTTPPTLVSTNATSSTTVNLVFSEKISQETAEVVGNYIIDELTVLNAHLQTDSITVTLTTAEQTEGETYTITVNNVEDLAGNPIESNSTIDFTGYQSGGGENDLLFSDYIEGSSNNKALEIYNGTGASANLSNYRIVGSYNGSGWQSSYYSFPEETNLPNGDVWVIANEDADQAILNVADDILAYNEGGYVVSFNGNDARGLEKTSDGRQTWTLIDVIGVPTEDPGDGQGWTVAGEENATINHTLVRKNSVITGNTDWTSSACTNQDDSEWIVYPQDTFEYLGSHNTSVEDTIPPTLVSANATSSTIVNLIFSEKISQETAEVISNYSINGLTVSSANLQVDSITVGLTTSEQTEGETYTITVNNVEDLAGNPIESNSTIDFTGYQSGGGENDLLFSDYIEGSSNNKALEIYNGTGASINLSNYRIVGSYNGSGWQSSYYSFPDNTTLANGDVWVIANEDADQAILNVADDILAYNEGGYVVSFNGNDARGLEKTSDGRQTWTLIDVIGVPTEDPGDGQGWTVAGEENATINHTLVRKNSVITGNTDWTSSACTNQDDSEWIVYPQDTFEYLGSHGGGAAGNVEYPAQPVPANEPATITFTSQDTCKSVELLWNTIKGNEFKSTCMNFIDSTLYSYAAEIPGQPEGTIVYFYITASDTSDSVSYFPENAPKELYQYEYKVETLKAVLKVPHHTFCPALGEKFEIQFHSRTNDKIILRLYNCEGKLVNTFKNENSNGLNTIEWDGRDETWNTLPPGLYICHLEVIDRETGKTKTDTAPIVIAVPLKD